MYNGFSYFGVRDQRAMAQLNQRVGGRFFPPMQGFRPQQGPRYTYPNYMREERMGQAGRVYRFLPPGMPR